VDLDSCRDPHTGQLETRAGEIVERLDSYTEASPSGTGVHIIAKAPLPPEGRKKGKIEMYDSGQFFTVTGEHIGGTPTTIEERTVEVAALHAEVFGQPQAKNQPPAPIANGSANGHTNPLPDDELIQKAKRAKNGEQFSRLWAGDITGYPSQSEADLALCSSLAFWCGNEPERIDGLFRQSGLYRKKWDEKHFSHGQTYGEATIATALGGAREFYNSNGARGPATDSQEEAPRPLRRSLPDPEPFPLAALDALGAPARLLAETIQAPLALCGQSILAAATLAVQPYRDIILDGRTIPLCENFLTVGESGERKTAVDQEALRPHRAHEQQLHEQYEAKRPGYENDLIAYNKARDKALKDRHTREEKKFLLEAIGAPPDEPLLPNFITEEPTYEGLVKLLLRGQPSVGLFSDEGGRMIGGYGMSEEQQLKTAAGLCELWDGKRISRVRGGDGASLLYGRRLSMHLMAQPRVAQQLLSNALLVDQGFLSRCLTAWPTSTAGIRKYKPVDLRTAPALTQYESRIRQILQTPLPLAEKKRNELAPRSLLLSQEAKEMWMRIHDEIEEQLADGALLAPVRSFASKAPEHALRLAGVLTLYENLGAKEVPAEHIRGGIELVRYYLAEALRLFHAGMTPPDLDLAEKLLKWAQQHAPYVALVDMYQRGLNEIRDAATARKLAKILEDHGWFVPVRGGMVIDATFRREVWAVKR
jgi:hypothetical protein